LAMLSNTSDADIGSEKKKGTAGRSAGGAGLVVSE
jgi:hypothetical protein